MRASKFNFPDRDGPCSFCSKNYPLSRMGMWSFKETPSSTTRIFCCHSCALYILPAFIADSVDVGSHFDNEHKIMKTYWRAVYCRGDD